MTISEAAPSFDIARVATRTFEIIGRNLMVLAALTVLLWGLPHLGAEIADSADDLWHGPDLFFGTGALYFLVGMVGYFALQASVVQAAVSDLNGRPADFFTCLKTGFRYFFPVFGVVLVTCLAVLGGLIALVVPGLMILTAWLVAVPAAVVEGERVGDALRRSAELTRGYRWPIFGLIVLFAFATFLIHGVIWGAESAAGRVLGFLPGGPMHLTSALFEGVSALVGAVGAVAIYYELRSLKEDAGPEDLAATLS